ncbi:MAG: hypothetical protein ACKO72_08945 [Actinomycetes bacterium]
METTARDLARIERRLREARGYSEGYGKLLHHSARKVLAASGFELPDDPRPIPIDPDRVELQIERFTNQPASDRRPRSSTAANYAENWRRFARWTRDYLRAEAGGEEDLYLHKLGTRAPKRARRSPAPERFDDSVSLYAASFDEPLADRSFAAEASRAMSMAMPSYPRTSLDGGFAYPASNRSSDPEDRRVITVKTSFGPFRMELPRDLRAEDAARIARAVLRLVD